VWVTLQLGGPVCAHKITGRRIRPSWRRQPRADSSACLSTDRAGRFVRPALSFKYSKGGGQTAQGQGGWREPAARRRRRTGGDLERGTSARGTEERGELDAIRGALLCFVPSAGRPLIGSEAAAGQSAVRKGLRAVGPAPSRLAVVDLVGSSVATVAPVQLDKLPLPDKGSIRRR
jgi:hypothetical protein